MCTEACACARAVMSGLWEVGEWRWRLFLAGVVAGDEQTGRGWRIHSWRVASRQQRDGVRVGRVGMCRALRKLLSPRESSELAARWREGREQEPRLRFRCSFFVRSSVRVRRSVVTPRNG